MNWTITLLADNKTVKITESTTNILSVFPIATFAVTHDPDDSTNEYVTIDGVNNNFVFKMKVSEITSPLLGANTYEQYVEKLGRRLNGDNTVVF
jgi:hypothetical protein